MGFGRGGDRIEPRLQRIERLDEGLRVGANAAELLDRGEHVEGRGVAVGVVPGAQRLGLLPALAAGDVGIELEQHVGRGTERDAVDEDLAQRAPADRKIRRRVDRRDDGIDQRRVVRRNEAEAVADRVVETRLREVEFDVPGFLFRALLIEEGARNHRGGDGLVAGSPGSAGCGWRLSVRRQGRHRHECRHEGRCRGRTADLIEQSLEHARSVFAARHAKIQPRLLPLEDRSRIVLAARSALTAILLRHGRHHAAAEVRARRQASCARRLGSRGHAKA